MADGDEPAVKRLSGVGLVGRDLPRLRAFYRQVLEIEPQGDDDVAVFVKASFETDGANLCLFTEAGMEEMAPGSMVNAGWGGDVVESEVADVDAADAHL